MKKIFFHHRLIVGQLVASTDKKNNCDRSYLRYNTRVRIKLVESGYCSTPWNPRFLLPSLPAPLRFPPLLLGVRRSRRHRTNPSSVRPVDRQPLRGCHCCCWLPCPHGFDSVRWRRRRPRRSDSARKMSLCFCKGFSFNPFSIRCFFDPVFYGFLRL